MKAFILFSALFCLHEGVWAQSQQQPDSVPPPSLWVRANTPSHGSVGTVYLSRDTGWAISSDIGLLLSTDAGLNWRSIPLPIRTIRDLDPVVSPSFRTGSEGYLFPIYQGYKIYKTTNAGTTWDSMTSPMAEVQTAFIIDSLRVFTAGGDQIGRTTDGGKTWDVQGICCMGAIGFANAKIGYAMGAARIDSGTRREAQCGKTVDSGKTWNHVVTNIPYDVEAIAVVDPATVVAACSHIIVRTSDGGATWYRTPVPDTTVAYWGITIHGTEGYATGSHGIILHTFDTGKTWIQEPSGLTSEYLYTPVMSDDSSAAVADDNGIILIRKFGSSGVTPTPFDSLSVSVFPNPAQESITMQYSLSEGQHVTLVIYDAPGHLIASALNAAPQSAGNQSVTISTANLASGTYFYQFSSENYSASGSFSVIR